MIFAQTEPTFAAQIVGGYLMFLLAASMIGWFWLAQRRQATGYLLPQSDGPLTRWGIRDLVLMICLWLASQAAGLKLASIIGGFSLGASSFESLSTEQRTIMIVTTTALQWVAMAIFVAWLKLGVGASWRELGLSFDLLGKDLKVGGFAFLLITPPVMMLQAGLSSLFPEEQHPFIEAINDEAGIALISGIAFAAVITAPWFEELMFRVVALGWLEQFFAMFEEESPLEGAPRAVENTPYSPLPDAEGLDESTGPASKKENPYASPTSSDTPAIARSGAGGPRAGWRPIPIILSALMFGAVHLGHGPAPISLFFFALGLGYVYQRTRRLVPCVIIHTLLNAQTTAMLFLLAGSEVPTT